MSSGRSRWSVKPACCNVGHSRFDGRPKCSPDHPDHRLGLIPTSNTRSPGATRSGMTFPYDAANSAFVGVGTGRA